MYDVRRIYIILWLCGLSMLASALPVNREMEFKYYFYAAKGLIENKQYADALMLFRFCETINPNDGATKEYLGLIYSALGETGRAQRYFAQAYEAAPEDLWYNYAQSLYQSEDKKERQKAVKIVEQAAKAHPKDEDVWQTLMKVYVSEQRFKDAIKVQDHIDGIKGYDNYSAYTRYQLYRWMNNPKKALAEVEKYVALEPRDHDFQVLRAQLYEYLGVKWEKLEAAYQIVLKVEPNNILILNNYAYGLAVNGGDLKQAEKMSQMTLRAEPDNPVYLDTYAWILHLQGQDSLAAFYIRKALDNLTAEMKGKNKVFDQHYKAIVK